MTVSLEEALNLFVNWKEDSVRVSVSFMGGHSLPDNPAAVRTHLEGVVSSVERSGTVSIQGNNCVIDLDLRECRFACKKASDPPAFGDSTFAAGCGLVLEIKFPGGEHCLVVSFVRPN